MSREVGSSRRGGGGREEGWGPLGRPASCSPAASPLPPMGDASVPPPLRPSPAPTKRAGKKGGDPWVALRPVPLPLPTCPPWATVTICPKLPPVERRLLLRVVQFPGYRPCRFANNKLGRKNQWRCFFCALYYGNEPLHGPTTHSDAVLAHSCERWSGILTEYNIIEADQGNIVWNAQTLLRERAKNTDRHEIASGNDSGKIATLG